MRYCYDYNADRYCEPCGIRIKDELDELDFYSSKSDEIDYNDSNNYPQKTNVYEIEPGAPEHCASCLVFIPAPPNSELLQYVRMEAETDVAMYGSLRETTALWVRFYKVTVNQEVA